MNENTIKNVIIRERKAEESIVSHKHDIEEMGIKILTASRQELYISMRYLFEMLNMFEYKTDKAAFFVGTDGENILFNPTMLAKRYMKHPVNVNRAYMHMILHCIFRNIFTDWLKKVAESEEKSGSSYEELCHLWDTACDIAAEYIIDGMEESSVQALVSDRRDAIYRMLKEKCRIMSAENIFRYLYCLTEQERNRWTASDLFLVDDHRYWYQTKKEENSDRDSEKDADEKDSDEKEVNGENDIARSMAAGELEDSWEKAGEKLLTELTTFGNGTGKGNQRLTENLNVGKRETYSYAEFLRKFAVLKEEMHVDMDSFDYGFYNYGIQTFGNMPLIEELEYTEEKRIEEFVIVIDTSGSCGGKLVKRFLEETYSILTEKEKFFRKVNIHVLQCDNVIQSDTYITNAEELKELKDHLVIQGYGGTDFRPAFAYVDRLIEKGSFTNLRGMLYFTDGYGTYPKRKPSYNTAFVILREYESETEVPPWAFKIELEG